MAIYEFDGIQPVLDADTYVADQATVIGKVTLEAGASIWPQAVLRGDNEPIVISQGSNVQEGAVLHTDLGYPLMVEERVTIGHQAMLHGCHIGAGSLVGIQAVVLNGAVIGKNSLVGAGAVVTEGKVFPDNALILGAPAKVVKTLDREAIEQLHKNADAYVDNGRQYKSLLKKLS